MFNVMGGEEGRQPWLIVMGGSEGLHPCLS